MPELDDEQLSRLLRSVSAAPGDAAWTRAMARVAVDESAPTWLAWVTRPAALAAAACLLVCATGASVWWTARADSAVLAQQVLAAGGVSDSPDLGLGLNSGADAVRDSGEIQ